MTKKTVFCDICGSECIGAENTNKSVSLSDRSDYFHVKGMSFTVALDICETCQTAVQQTLDRLSGTKVQH